MSDQRSVEELKAKIDPQQAEALARNAQIVAGLGGPGEGIAQIRERANAAREVWNQGGPAMAVDERHTIPGPFRDVPVHLYKPSDGSNMPVFVYLHGGGFKIGYEDSNDRQMRELAAAWGGAVLSADYVHVPEHRFPDPVLEIAAVVDWLSKNGQGWGLDGSRIVIGGASAGASVAFGTAYELRDTGRGDMLKGVISLYGVIDTDLETRSMRELGGGDFMLTRDYTRQVYADYTTDDEGWNDPRAYALKGDPQGLPPVFVAAAELDPIGDDSRALAKKFQGAGHSCRFEDYKGVMHAFFVYSDMIDEAKRLIADMRDFLVEQIGKA